MIATMLLRRFLKATSPRLVGSDFIPEAQKWEMLDELYRFSPSVIAALAFLGATLAAWIVEPSPRQWYCVFLSVVGIAGRYWLTQCYLKRSAGDDIGKWIRRFVVAAILTGCQWGVCSALLYMSTDITLKLTALTCCCAILGGAVARAYCHPNATASQLGFAVGIMLVPIVAEGNWGFAVLCVLYFAFQMNFLRSFGQIRLNQILADHERRTLLSKLQDTNVDLASANDRLDALAHTDGLTGIANRRRFDERLADLWNGAASRSAQVSLLLIDVDHFKRFNDTYGHLAGDECLIIVAHAARSCLKRSGDLAARYGGEEFAIVMSDAPAEYAGLAAEQIRRTIEAIDLSHLPGMPAGVTVSIGVATLDRRSAKTPACLIESADRALYDAKQAGRNRVRVAELAIAEPDIEEAVTSAA